MESTQIIWFSKQSDGRLDLVRGGQRHSRESWKTTLGSQGTYSKHCHSNSLKRFNLLFLRVRRRKGDELLIMKTLMIMQ
jgi:hypothetical protein